jgi:hypothetical protein
MRVSHLALAVALLAGPPVVKARKAIRVRPDLRDPKAM